MKLLVWLSMIWFVQITSIVHSSQGVEIFRPRIKVFYTRQVHKANNEHSTKYGYYVFPHFPHLSLTNNSYFLNSGKECYCDKPCVENSFPVVNLGRCNYSKEIINEGNVSVLTNKTVIFTYQGQMQYLQVKKNITPDVWSTENDTLYVSGLVNTTPRKFVLEGRSSFVFDSNDDEETESGVTPAVSLGFVGLVVLIAAVCFVVFGGSTVWKSIIKNRTSYKSQNSPEELNNSCDDCVIKENNYYHSSSTENVCLNVTNETYHKTKEHPMDFYGHRLGNVRAELGTTEVGYAIPYFQNQHLHEYESYGGNGKSHEYAEIIYT